MSTCAKVMAKRGARKMAETLALYCSPKGPSTQWLGTRVLGDSNYSARFG